MEIHPHPRNPETDEVMDRLREWVTTLQAGVKEQAEFMAPPE